MSEVAVDLVRPVPAWALRGAVALLGAATLLVAFAGARLHPVVVAALVALVVAIAVVPDLGLTGLVVLVAAAGVVADPPGLGAVMLLVLLVHLTLWAGALAARTSWRTQVEVAVVVRGVRDVAAVQVGAQLLAVVALVLGGVVLGAGDLWRALALVAAIGAAALLLPRRS
ncbi:hypothetical protein [Cellulomonas xylanilytica]|uniref:Uncharacterized protein n=1 Tax=Cellulomonas xylanilytica TaxID=233583 RepID=A0A510V586_9CELL|nr:hypothetical protein [Cellulomonas xylanilytica]GEK21976.1 hypothetical protein CXY01_24960 [Cellulomonas xylanilytica]